MTLVATAAHGCQVKVGDGASSEVFTAVEGITSGPSGPGWTTNMLEARIHSSDSPVRKVSSLTTEPVTFTILYDSTNTQHIRLRTLTTTKARGNFQVLLTDTGAEQYAFAAYVSLSLSSEVDGFNTASVTLNIDGDITVS